MLTGTYTDYWTTALQIRDLAGKESSNLTVDHWCGGEGLVANLCALLDATHLARTTELGGETTTEGSVMVADLSNGSTVGQHGPFPGLSRMLGTTVAERRAAGHDDREVRHRAAERARHDRPARHLVGRHDRAGGLPEGLERPVRGGGQGRHRPDPGRQAGARRGGCHDDRRREADPNDTVVGCSADGAFLYIQNISQPPTGEEDDEPPGLSSALERVNIATGARDTVAVMPPGEWVGPVTR